MKRPIPEEFRAFRVRSDGERITRGVERVSPDVLPDNDVIVAVEYSSLNYKDALSASGNRGVTKSYPHTPGIDLAGTVVSSRDERFGHGDEVLCTGYDLGMDTPGGFADYASVPGDWLVHRPRGLQSRTAMTLGTAGLTAALALARLRAAGVTSSLGPLVVTGASGGVGSLGVWLAARAGFEVIASTGTRAAGELLRRLGSTRTMDRAELAEETSRPLLSGDYAGAIDTVGGNTLANLLKRVRVGGAVAACGLVGGAELETTVFPFILRGVALMGVDSQHAGAEERVREWAELAAAAGDDPGAMDAVCEEVDLDGLEPMIRKVLAGDTVGRVVVRVASR